MITGPPWPGTRRAGHLSVQPDHALRCTAPLCVLLTLISMGCSLDSPAKAPPFDPVTRRIDSTLAGESLRHKGADYATRRLELPTFVWSVVPPGLDSPAPRGSNPRRGPLLRQRGTPPDHRKPGRRAAASRRKQHLRPGLAEGAGHWSVRASVGRWHLPRHDGYGSVGAGREATPGGAPSALVGRRPVAAGEHRVPNHGRSRSSCPGGQPTSGAPSSSARGKPPAHRDCLLQPVPRHALPRTSVGLRQLSPPS